MKRTGFYWVAIGVLGLLGGATAMAAPTPPWTVPSRSTHFEAVGRVTLHPGQPCTPQVMFDFRGKTIISLAAPKRETAVLTEAARHHRRMRVTGNWRHVKGGACSFVEVTRAVPEKGFLGIF